MSCVRLCDSQLYSSLLIIFFTHEFCKQPLIAINKKSPNLLWWLIARGHNGKSSQDKNSSVTAWCSQSYANQMPLLNMQTCQDHSLFAVFFPKTNSPQSTPAEVWSLWPGRLLIRQLAGQQLRSIAYLFSRENNTFRSAKLNADDCKLDEFMYLKPPGINVSIQTHFECLSDRESCMFYCLSRQ